MNGPHSCQRRLALASDKRISAPLTWNATVKVACGIAGSLTSSPSRLAPCPHPILDATRLDLVPWLLRSLPSSEVRIETRKQSAFLQALASLLSAFNDITK
ncbi:hypothetical protein NDU88_001615 [Pleurodeles waltl]|uniref:Uncharacterized protein n=1 Tax=Pleurodeles waltl TaxID=8319 RepID=A0AAV7UTC0_PLEWA|nr:hypothetical protein NDU88_001615 [Pleurodeles waltl]